MTPVGMMPSFGQLTTSSARGPRSTQAFQNKEMSFINLSSTQQPQSNGKMSADVAADFAGIRANQGPQQNQSWYGKIVDHFVGKQISKAMSS